MKGIASAFSLFTSSATLVCCALPALFVSLGAGAVFVGIISTFPQLIWLSENKGLVFGLAGVMLIGAGLLQWRARHEPCPIDPELREACTKQRKLSLWIYAISVFIFLTGAFFAFLLPLTL